MLSDGQIEMIDEEIVRLKQRMEDHIPRDASVFIEGKIDALKWIKLNL